MKIVVIVLLVAGSVVAASQFGLLQKLTKLTSKLPSTHISLPNIPQVNLAKEEQKDDEKKEEVKEGSPERTALQGKVAGIATSAQNTLQGVSTLFLSTPAPGSESINVGTVVNQISKQVEGIPSHLLNQAKVQYCQQVLIEATKSAQKQIE